MPLIQLVASGPCLPPCLCCQNHNPIFYPNYLLTAEALNVCVSTWVFSAVASHFPKAMPNAKVASSSTLELPSSLLCSRPWAQWEMETRLKQTLLIFTWNICFLCSCSRLTMSPNKSGLRQMQIVLKLRFHARPDVKILFTLDVRGKLQQRSD